MAVLDEATQKIVVRIIYDGPVRAGKSTNLRQLCRVLTPLRRSELFVPGELSGRTLYFDWLQLEAGVVGGRPLRCQFVTVPGQNVFHRRRRLLLEAADAVVFVCESTVQGIRQGSEALVSLRNFLATYGSNDTSMIVQANKQDLPRALSVDDVVKGLGLPSDTAAVAAAAENGLGVRETAVLAIRAAASRVQETLLTSGPDALRGRAETGEELHESILEFERRAPLSPAEAIRALRSPDEPHPAPIVVGTACSTGLLAEPTRPTPDAPTGTIWPTPEGRAILRAIERERLERRGDLSGQPGTSDGSGKTDAFIYEAGPWCLKTSRRRFYLVAAEARAALVALVRAKLGLGPFLVPRTVLCLSADRGEGQWLWTVTPWLKTLRSEMAEAEAAGDEAELGRALEAFARTAVSALALAARSGRILDLHPSNLARVDGRIAYLDDDIGSGSTIPAIGYNLLQRVEEYAHRAGAVSRYLEAVEAAIPSELSREEAEKLELESAIEQAVVRSKQAREAQRRLRGVIGRSAFAVSES